MSVLFEVLLCIPCTYFKKRKELLVSTRSSVNLLNAHFQFVVRILRVVYVVCVRLIMASSSSKTSYKSLTIAQKVAVIREVEKGLKKKSEIAKEFGIPPNTFSTYLKNKDKILRSETQNKTKARKRTRGPDNPNVDKCVLKWFKQARDNKIPISGPIMRTKAEQFASALGNQAFKASTGWLDGFKNRNGISFKTVCGESGSVDVRLANDWKRLLKTMIEDTEPKNIFNVDETGLFYKCTPDKTLAFKEESCSGGKLSKDRVTLLVGANMDGSQKLPLLMIGKSANPRCFKNVKSKPVDYESNKKAWMTGEIFGKWFLNLDKKFGKEKRKILLFINNCSAHNTIPQMENVMVIFFPANMTSVVQPMDQGIIKNLKHLYRRLLVKNVLVGDFGIKNPNILDASRMYKQDGTKVLREPLRTVFKRLVLRKLKS